MANLFLPQIMRVDNTSMGVNYGCEKVRFPAAVPVGSRIRARCELLSVSEVKGSIEVVEKYTVEVEGQDRPACIAEAIMRLYY